MAIIDDIKKFTNSPQGLAMAIGLLGQSGWSARPKTLGEAFGHGLLGVQEADQREFANKRMMDELGLKREGMDLRKMESEGYLQNLRHQQGLSSQRMNMAMEDRARQIQAMQNIQNLIGSQGTPGTPEIPKSPEIQGIPWAPEQIGTTAVPATEGTPGSGLLGGQPGAMQEIAKNLLQTGDYRSALGLLTNPDGDYGAPKEVINPETGKAALAQVSKKTGKVRYIDDALPAAKKGGPTITLKDGTVINMSGDNNEIGQATRNLAEKQIVQAKDLLKSSQEAMKFYDKNYLMLPGKTKKEFINAAEFLGVPLTKSQKDFTGNETNFKHMVGRGFHNYMKIMVGSRPGQKLYEYMLESYPNMKLRPSQFEYAMQSIQKSLQDTVDTYQNLLKTGNFTEQEAYAEASKNLDSGFDNILDNLVENSDELKKKFAKEEGVDRLGLGL